jgi:hypothetical protein
LLVKYLSPQVPPLQLELVVLLPLLVDQFLPGLGSRVLLSVHVIQNLPLHGGVFLEEGGNLVIAIHEHLGSEHRRVLSGVVVEVGSGGEHVAQHFDVRLIQAGLHVLQVLIFFVGGSPLAWHLSLELKEQNVVVNEPGYKFVQPLLLGGGGALA